MQELFGKYLRRECSPAEIEALMKHFNQPENALLLKQLILDELKSTVPQTDDFTDTDIRLKQIHQRLATSIRVSNKPVKKSQRWKWISIAASLLIVLGCTYYFMIKPERPAVLIAGNVKIVKPGGNAATLVLANGTRILLSNARQGQLATQSGALIIKDADGSLHYESTGNSKATDYNTLSTAEGEQFTIELPDGSVVTLNAGSSLRYPASFAGLPERNVELHGEGYFDVKHNRQQPFKVKAGGQIVQDIGTQFNISNYANELTVQTTLVQGSARVITTAQEAILNPGQQAVLKDKLLKTHEVNTEVFTAWKRGLFAYQDTKLDDVMRQIARWYNVKIIYTDDALRNRRLSGSVSRYDEVKGILEAISYTAKVRFVVSGRTVEILPGSSSNND